MKISALSLTAAALLLAACGTTDSDRSGHRHHDHGRHHHGHGHPGHGHGHGHPGHERNDAAKRNDAVQFTCQNGLTVHIRPVAQGRIELRLDDKQAVLAQDTSGSGERYTGSQGLFGSGAEWHQKGSQAAFSFKDPYGNQVDTACNSSR